MYRGSAGPAVQDKTADILDSKANLLSTTATSWDYIVYALFLVYLCCTCFCVVAVVDGEEKDWDYSVMVTRVTPSFVRSAVSASVQAIVGSGYGPQVMGVMVSVGPIVVGTLLLVTSNVVNTSTRKLLLFPFHNEHLFGWFGMHVVMGVILCIVPVYHAVTTLMLPAGESVGCRIWSCEV